PAPGPAGHGEPADPPRSAGAGEDGLDEPAVSGEPVAISLEGGPLPRPHAEPQLRGHQHRQEGRPLRLGDVADAVFDQRTEPAPEIQLESPADLLRPAPG